MINEPAQIRIAVIGLGNELMADDGVGIHAIRRLRTVLPPEVPCVEIGTASLQAQDICEQSDIVIALDAVQADGSPGSVYLLDIADAATPEAESLHSLSLAGVIRLIPPAHRPRVLVVGVQPARVEYSLVLSEPVEAALPRVIRAVCEIVRSVGDLAAIEENS
ncbi:MAG: hydrogenase maturation protease [Phycisphaerales bacterium]